MHRTNISTDTKWEHEVGYSRAVRIGDQISVSGTTATTEDGSIIGVGDVYLQTVQILKNIARTLGLAGGSLNDVVRTRIFVIDISNWQEVAKAHREVFGSIGPATSMVEVRRFIAPEILVEIEAEAICSNKDTPPSNVPPNDQ